MKVRILALLALVLLVSALAFGQTTEFKYQGHLQNSSVPANGSFDFEFALFDAATGGAQIGTTLTRSSVAVANGIFAVSLDFGNGFPGANRFLEIRVRQSGGGGFTQLLPRQSVTSSPYAVRSITADSATVALNATTANNATTAVTANTANNALQLGGVAANQYVLTTDPRLSDPRTPAAGSGNYVQNQNAGVQASSNFNISGTGSANVLNAITQFNLNGARILSFPGLNNLFVGASAGNGNTTGNNNSFAGSLAGFANTTGNRNSFFGSEAGFLPANGSDNSFFGYQAGRVSSGSSNSFFGSQSGAVNALGSSNSFFGRSAGAANSSGSSNSFFGAGAGDVNNFASDNSFFGKDAGGANTSGEGNSFFGSSSGFSNTIGGSNSFFGFRSGDSNTDGGGNSFFGASSGRENTSGNFNSFFGGGSGLQNSTGSNNSFYGSGTGDQNSTGNENSFFGANAGGTNTTASSNSFFGYSAGVATTTTGNSNSFFGANAGGGNTVGTNNSYFGRNAGITGTQGDFNTVIGSGADLGVANMVFATAIGAGAVVTTNNRIQLGRDGSDFVTIGRLTTAGSQVCMAGLTFATCSSSRRYKENIQSYSGGLDIVRRFRPVTFDWIERKEPDLGLIAEEVAEIDPLLVTHNQNGTIEGVKYDQLTVVLINAIKEQQKQIEDLKATVCELNPFAAVCK